MEARTTSSTRRQAHAVRAAARGWADARLAGHRTGYAWAVGCRCADAFVNCTAPCTPANSRPSESDPPSPPSPRHRKPRRDTPAIRRQPTSIQTSARAAAASVVSPPPRHHHCLHHHQCRSRRLPTPPRRRRRAATIGAEQQSSCSSAAEQAAELPRAAQPSGAPRRAAASAR